MRGGAALAALTAGAWIYPLMSRNAPHEVGIVLFGTLTILANLYALLAGLRTTADCLSEEKREGTLGLLFLTDLKGYDVVLGKLAATSLNAFYGLLAMFPVMGITLLMGGVSPGEFGRVVLATVNNLLFSLAVGMFCSSVSQDDRKAQGATFLLVLIAAGLPLIGLGFAASMNRPRPALGFLIPSPGFTCFAAFDANYRAGGFATLFWVSAAAVHGLTWMLLGLACFIVPRAWQDKLTRSGRPSFLQRCHQWQLGSPEVRQALRSALLEVNPVLWLTCRERFKPWLVFTGLVGLAAVFLFGCAKLGRDWFGLCIPFALGMHTLLKVWLSNEACRRFAEDRHSGSIELLLATPLSVRQIVYGQQFALWRQFGWPTLAVLAADFLLMVGGGRQIHPDEEAWFGVWLAGMAMLLWDLFALSWVSPWMGLKSAKPSRASQAALMQICVLPWMMFGGGMAMLSILEEITHRGLRVDHWSPGIFIAIWFVISGACNLLFSGWARRRLLRDFREVATRRPDTKSRAGEWGRVLGEWLKGKR